MPMDVKILSLCTFICLHFTRLETRQMCISCQFSSPAQLFSTARGKECISAPLNWTGGDPHTKCPHGCIISSLYDIKTSVPTFFLRQCSGPDVVRKNGCLKSESTISCYYYCGGGIDYCNNKTGSTDLNDIVDDDGDDEDDNRDDMTASLYCLMAIIAVCATGYFLKKKYCTKPGDLEEGGVS